MTHIVASSRFAGVERYVSEVVPALAARGYDCAVVGGSPATWPALPDEIAWTPAGGLRDAFRGALRGRPADVLHVHMTAAEAVGVAVAACHRSALVCTRHFARSRGSSIGGRIFSGLFNRVVDRQIAISEFVACHLETPPDTIILPGTPEVDDRYRSDSRLVLYVARLEAEKRPRDALAIWEASGLARFGWRLRLLGEGSMRRELTELADSLGILESVEFAGWSADIPSHLVESSVLLATADAEPFGLSVLEAMAYGIPVVATASGGHVETLGRVADAALFPAGDVLAGALALRSVALDERRRVELSEAEREEQRKNLSLETHVDRLEDTYQSVVGSLHVAG